MKQQIITDVIQKMLPHLDNVQLKQLQKVLEATLLDCEITEYSANTVLPHVYLYELSNHYGKPPTMQERYRVVE